MPNTKKSKKRIPEPSTQEPNVRTGTVAELIYVVCDKCNEPIPTGIAADVSRMNGRRFGNNRTHCTSCVHMIVWSKAKRWPQSFVQAKRKTRNEARD